MTSSAGRPDIAIAGAGVAGLVTAALLAERCPGLSIRLLDPTPVPQFTPEADFDLRVSAWAPRSTELLERCGVWPRIRDARAAPYSRMVVWDAATTPERGVHFDAADVGVDALGYIVENSLVRAALADRLREYENVALDQARIEAMHDEGARVRVGLADGKQLLVRLVIGADGRDSRVRDIAGLPVRGWSHDQAAIVSHLRPAQAHRDTAWQRFLPSGPLALLPLADGRVSLVWSTGEEAARQLLKISDASFERKVSSASAAVLGDLAVTTKRVSFPLRSHYAKRCVAHRIALVGDAAHAVHPLAGQGANLGLADAAALVGVVSAAQRSGQDFGDLAVLRRYARMRKADNLSMVHALDGLNRLFARQEGPVAYLRRSGMRLFDRTASIKRLAMGHAMGVVRD